LLQLLPLEAVNEKRRFAHDALMFAVSTSKIAINPKVRAFWENKIWEIAQELPSIM